MALLDVSKPFVAGFLAGVGFPVAANLYSYAQTGDFDIADLLRESGWPFPLYRSGTILHLNQILWGGLAADVSIAVSASLILGQVCAAVSERRAVR